VGGRGERGGGARGFNIVIDIGIIHNFGLFLCKEKQQEVSGIFEIVYFCEISFYTDLDTCMVFPTSI